MPAVVVVTEVFENLAAHGCARAGLPCPAHAGAAAPDGIAPRGRGPRHRPAIAFDAPDRAPGRLGADGARARSPRSSARSRTIPTRCFAYVEAQGWGDGLPVIPPTEARVQAMLDADPAAAGARRRRRRAAPRRGDGREDRRQRGAGRLPARVLPGRARRRARRCASRASISTRSTPRPAARRRR